MVVFEFFFLEVVLRHNAKAICRILRITHILAATVEVLYGKRQVRGEIEEGIAEDVVTPMVLVIAEIAIMLIERHL